VKDATTYAETQMGGQHADMEKSNVWKYDREG
jgi:hypothetical protein